MKMRVIALCAAAVFLPFTAACSSNNDGKKKQGSDQDITVGGSTVAELSDQLQKSGVPEQQADCLAESYSKLDLSEAQLEKLQQGDTSVLQGTDMVAYAQSAAECMRK